ncbi:MAG: carboxypeptidase-like regulatory domain-containing protein [Planctomycetota bacterium]
MRDEDDQGVLDVLLDERLGAIAPPDLSARLRARWRRGDGVAAARRVASARGAAPPRAWLAAAVVVLGFGVVLAVAFLRAHGNTPGEGVPAGPAAESAAAAATSMEEGSSQQAPAGRPDRQDGAPTGNPEVELVVVDEHGGPVQSFRLTILQVDARGVQGLVPIPDLPARDVGPRDFHDGVLAISGLPEGKQVAMVEAAPYVRSFSEPFEATAPPAPRVTVRLDRGRVVTGTVLGPTKVPLAGVTVRIEPDRPFSSMPTVAALFGAATRNELAGLWTVASTATDAAGRFRFVGLVPGSYTVSVAHPSYCAAEVDGCRPAGDAPLDVQVALQAGAIVVGEVRGLDGAPVAGAEVMVSEQPAGPLPEGPVRVSRATLPQSWRTTSDGSGRFRFAVRLRPGTYKIHPVPALGDNPLESIVRIKKSTLTLTVAPGVDEVESVVTLR